MPSCTETVGGRRSRIVRDETATARIVHGRLTMRVRCLYVSTVPSTSMGPFAAREPLFAHGDISLRLLLPRSADELIDEDAFARDERLPYWADLWPAAKSLARYVLDHPPQEGSPTAPARIIELGCGAAALASLVLALRGAHVLATDYEPQALDIVQANIHRHNSSAAGLRTRTIDWRDSPGDLGEFDLVLGADLMYEQRNAIALADFVPTILAPAGRMLLADPGRRYLPEFESLMRQRGFIDRDLAMIEELHDDPAKPSSRVRIIEFARERKPDRRHI